MKIIGVILIVVVIALYLLWFLYSKNREGVKAKTDGEIQIFDILVKFL